MAENEESQEEESCDCPKCPPPGAPAWMSTFADLATLLMCFFVLILSFSEMDVQKYKQVAGSMASAFGVQRDIFADVSPMGTSFVAREFTPGKPEPTLIKVIQQKTEAMRPHLQIMKKEAEAEAQARANEAKADRIREALRDEIQSGQVEVETEEDRIIIRIREQASFASGSADLKIAFGPVLVKISEVLAKEDTGSRIVISGHTDNIPIRGSGRFRSNWELSASRAVTVLEALLQRSDQLNPRQFLIEGHGEMQPLFPNTSASNRAANRRVEIMIEQDPNALLEFSEQGEDSAS